MIIIILTESLLKTAVFCILYTEMHVQQNIKKCHFLVCDAVKSDKTVRTFNRNLLMMEASGSFKILAHFYQSI